MQVLKKEMLGESESILYDNAWFLYYSTIVQVQYCKQFGSDTYNRTDIIFVVFYSLTEECFPNVPPKARQ